LLILSLGASCSAGRPAGAAVWRLAMAVGRKRNDERRTAVGSWVFMFMFTMATATATATQARVENHDQTNISLT
jgi:hypothetical protein